MVTMCFFDGEHRATFVELDAPGGFTDMRLVDKVTGRAVDRMIVGSWGYQEWMRARDRGATWWTPLCGVDSFVTRNLSSVRGLIPLTPLQRK